MGRKKIYIAGPLFSAYERKFLEGLVSKLSSSLKLNSKRDFFLPHRDAGDVGIAGRTRNAVFYQDIEELDNSKIVVALLDGPDVDSGTAVELGYAFAKGKPIFGLLTDKRRWEDSQIVGLNNMIWGVCNEGKRIHRTVNSLTSDLKSFTKK